MSSVSSSLHQQQSSACSFERLPFDVMLKILARISKWEDVSALQQASPLVRHMFGQRETWVMLVHSYTNPEEAMPKLCFAERPLYKYSIEELQAMFMRWKKAENILLTARDPERRRVRQINLNPAVFANKHFLAPGGRWLVVINIDASASYYDLDTPLLAEPTQLFPAQMSVSMDQSDAGEDRLYPNIDLSEIEHVHHAVNVLTFRFAISFTQDRRNRPTTMQVWEVIVDYDEDARRSYLSAQRLATIPFGMDNPDVIVQCLSGDYIAVNMPALSPQFLIGALGIFNWKEARDNPPGFERRVLIVRPMFFPRCTLVRHHLYFRTPDGLTHCDIRTLKVATSWSPADFNHHPEPNDSVTSRTTFFSGRNVSKPIPLQTSDSESAIVLFLDINKVKKVQIDHISGDTIYSTVGTLRGLNVGYVDQPGCRYAVSVRSQLILTPYEVEGVPHNQNTGTEKDTDLVYTGVTFQSADMLFLSCLDEGIARFVMSDGALTLYVVDFAV